MCEAVYTLLFRCADVRSRSVFSTTAVDPKQTARTSNFRKLALADRNAIENCYYLLATEASLVTWSKSPLNRPYEMPVVETMASSRPCLALDAGVGQSEQ